MSDYDFEPRSAKSQFLRLKDKGQSVTVRIASRPYREPKVWKEGVNTPLEDEKAAALTPEQWARIMGDPDYNVTEVFSWIVIDREDGQAKVFSTTPGVYKSIKEYAQTEQWGDPQRYDIKITRTEEPGRGYYTVQPFPDKSDLTDKEKAMVEKIDMRSLQANARALNETQLDDISDFLDQNNTPKAEADVPDMEGPKPQPSAEAPKDVVIEDIGDEPINLDDIPF